MVLYCIVLFLVYDTHIFLEMGRLTKTDTTKYSDVDSAEYFVPKGNTINMPLPSRTLKVAKQTSALHPRGPHSSESRHRSLGTKCPLPRAKRSLNVVSANRVTSYGPLFILITPVATRGGSHSLSLAARSLGGGKSRGTAHDLCAANEHVTSRLTSEHARLYRCT